jgi:hypothetical protein
MPPSIRIIKFKKHLLFEITDLKALIMSFMQYEDAVKVHEWFKLPEPRRPLALNLTDLFNYLTPENYLSEIYIPHYYEGELDLTDLYELDSVRKEYRKFISIQCPSCLNYNRLNFTLGKVERLLDWNYPAKPEPKLVCYLIVKQVFDVLQGISGRKFLCDCKEKGRTGSWKVSSITTVDPDIITKLLNGFHVPSPQRRL